MSKLEDLIRIGKLCETQSNSVRVEDDDFSGVYVKESERLSLQGINFFKTTINDATLSHVDMHDFSFITGFMNRSNVISTDMSFSEIVFSEFVMSSFENVGWNSSEFEACRFLNARFVNCNLSESGFGNCAFSGAIFVNCNMTNVEFIDGADFTNAKLTDIDLSTTNIDDCDFTGATLERVTLPANHNCQSISKATIIN